jgi:ADP-heptose:LPS heptosyltransferase
MQRGLEFFSSPLKETNSDQVIVIKLKGKGSIIRFVQMCEQMNADKSKLTLITFAHQQDVCEWLQLSNVIYIRTTNLFQFITDCWQTYRQVRKMKPRVVVSLERCSHAVNTFALLLSNGNKIVFFEPDQRVVSDKIIVHSANALSLEELFRTSIDELPKSFLERRIQKAEVTRNKIVVNVNASDLLSARRYSIDNFAEIIRELYQSDSSIQFILVGSVSERDYVEQLIRLLKEVPVKNLAGHFSFEELANEFANAAFVLTGDSMALHLAAYLQVPVVAIWGPTQPQHFGYSQNENIHSVTLNLPCAPCFIHPASKPAKFCNGRIDCLSLLKSRQVIEVCTELLMNNSIEREVNYPTEIDNLFKPKFAFE